MNHGQIPCRVTQWREMKWSRPTVYLFITGHRCSCAERLSIKPDSHCTSFVLLVIGYWPCWNWFGNCTVFQIRTHVHTHKCSPVLERAILVKSTDCSGVFAFYIFPSILKSQSTPLLNTCWLSMHRQCTTVRRITVKSLNRKRLVKVPSDCTREHDLDIWPVTPRGDKRYAAEEFGEFAGNVLNKIHAHSVASGRGISLWGSK